MAKVHFAVGWFGPGGQRFRKSRDKFDLRDVPDALLPQLPRRATVIDGSQPERPAEGPDTLRSFDAERAAAEAAGTAAEQAEKAAFAQAMAARRSRRR